MDRQTLLANIRRDITRFGECDIINPIQDSGFNYGHLAIYDIDGKKYLGLGDSINGPLNGTFLDLESLPLDGIEDIRREQIRQILSSRLVDTNEKAPLRFSDEKMVVIGEEEAQGLSSLELPRVTSLFQVPGEGTIWVNIEGCDEPMNIDDLDSSDLETILDAIAEEEFGVPKPPRYSGTFLVYAMAQLLLNKERKTVTLDNSSFACPEDIPVLSSAPKGRGLLETWSLPDGEDIRNRITLGCSPTLRADGKARPPYRGTFDGSEDEDFEGLFTTLYAELFDPDHDDPDWENWLDALKKDCETIPFPAIALRERLRRRGYSKESPFFCKPTWITLIADGSGYLDNQDWEVGSCWPEGNTVAVSDGTYTATVRDSEGEFETRSWRCRELLDIQLPKI